VGPAADYTSRPIAARLPPTLYAMGVSGAIS
jgi:hypothetical protein